MKQCASALLASSAVRTCLAAEGAQAATAEDNGKSSRGAAGTAAAFSRVAGKVAEMKTTSTATAPAATTTSTAMAGSDSAAPKSAATEKKVDKHQSCTAVAAAGAV